MLSVQRRFVRSLTGGDGNSPWGGSYNSFVTDVFLEDIDIHIYIYTLGIGLHMYAVSVYTYLHQ